MTDTHKTLGKVWIICAALLLVGLFAGMYTPRVSALSGGWAAPNVGNVSVGAEHACAAANGKAYCWGRNDGGQIGNGTYTSANVPTQVDMTGAMAGKTVTMVAAGWDSSCAVASGEVYCWGWNNYGRLGTGNTNGSPVPVKVVNTSGALQGKTVVSIALGSYHTCALTTSNEVACWGLGTSGQLGRGSTSTSYVPVAVNQGGVLAGKTVQKISTGGYHTCVAASGAAYCWGAGGSGRLGNSGTDNQTNPVAVTTSTGLSGKTVTDITAGYNAHSCAVASGLAYCWGLNSSGQLGNGTYTNSTSPVGVSTSGVLSGKTITGVGSGYSYTCVVVSDGNGSCWGWNGAGGQESGYLGNGTGASTEFPTLVDRSGEASGKKFTEISGGSYHTCGIASERVFCWGANNYGGSTDYGMLGANDQFGPALSPVQTRSSDTVAASPYRFYQTGTVSAKPGAPLASTNTPAVLSVPGQSFRVRMGIRSNSATDPIDIFSYNVDPRLQYAVKQGASCSAQTAGYQNMTDTTPISFEAVSGFINETDIIAADGNDPTGYPITYMRLHMSEAMRHNPRPIAGGNIALWDYTLKDNGAPQNTTYCIRTVLAGNGHQPLDGTALTAEISTVPPPSLGVSYVTPTGTALLDPSFSMNPAITVATCQTVTGLLANGSSGKLRVNQAGAPASWSISVAPTNGTTATWVRTDGQASYDFNDPSGSPAGCGSGSDGDGLAGQLTVKPAQMKIDASANCLTGTAKGANAAFTNVTGAITIYSIASSALSNCQRDLYDIELSQTLPVYQEPGQYTFDLTVTAVVQ